MRLAGLVRPSGYFRQKAKKLKAFCGFLEAEYRGSLAKMFKTPTAELGDVGPDRDRELHDVDGGDQEI